MKHLRILSLLAVCLFLSQLAGAQVTGSGTTNYIPIWTSSTAIGNSKLFQTSGNVGIGTTSPAWALDVVGHINATKAYKIGGNDMLAIPGGISGANIAVGYQALSNITTGGGNAACGYQALQSNTTGNGNTAAGFVALQFNTTGSGNVAVGDQALQNNFTGSWNTAVGTGAFPNINSGNNNTALGVSAMGYIPSLSTESTGNNNTATGNNALYFNLSGNSNTASGQNTLYNNTSGSQNTAIGEAALYFNTTGSDNIAIGLNAAANVSPGNGNNIHIGSGGSSTDKDTIRIGDSGPYTSFYAGGIYGASSGSSSAIPVLVDSSGQLVTISSSRRFKEDIHDMGDASQDLMRLRPVTFRYKKPLDDGSQPVQYGLIAEEVAEVYPDLVSYAADGQVQSVKYQLLDPMLLNEVQRLHAEVQTLQDRIDRMEAKRSSREQGRK